MYRLLWNISWGLQAVLLLYSCYYFLVALFGLRPQKNRPVFPPQKRIAVLVAARNEREVIGQLVETLQRQNYPKELYQVIVAPNNCTDDTREVARRAGARIYDCALPVRSKGDVLRQMFRTLLREDWDAFCIFDADNLVHPDFLSRMNDALCQGARAAQGYRDSKNPHDSWISSCYSIYYWMVNRLYSRSRSALGLSAIVNGSGFLVSADLLREMGGWRTYTMTEDIEFSTQCILRGVQVAWVPEAVTYDEQPLTFAQSWKQRKRWSTGLLQGFVRYFLPLARTGLRQRRAACFDQMLFFLAPFMQMMYVVSGLLTLQLNLLAVHQGLITAEFCWSRALLSLNLSFVIGTALAVLVVILEGKSSLRMLKGVAGYWLFITSWLPINLLCLFRRCTCWEEIRHTRKLKLSDLTLFR